MTKIEQAIQEAEDIMHDRYHAWLDDTDSDEAFEDWDVSQKYYRHLLVAKEMYRHIAR